MNWSADCEPAWMPSGRAPPAELLDVLMLPDLDRAERIDEFWSSPAADVSIKQVLEMDRVGLVHGLRLIRRTIRLRR